MTKIGCCAVVVNLYTNRVLGLQCSKGRGLILPGGKVEEFDKTYRHTAARECEEETGVVICPDYLSYVCGDMCVDGYYVHFFCTSCVSTATKQTDEGIPVWKTMDEFLLEDSYYHRTYDLLFNPKYGLVTLEHYYKR